MQESDHIRPRFLKLRAFVARRVNKGNTGIAFSLADAAGFHFPWKDPFAQLQQLRSMMFGLCMGLIVSTSQLHADEAANKDRESILAVLTLQTRAWNDGDIDRFMKHYWDSDQLTFSSGGQTLRGWKETEQRYKTRYVTPEQMGQLSFGKLEIQSLGRSAAYVLGEWHLERKAGNLSGNFTLIFRRINGHWLIVHDHTSLLPNDS